MAAIAVSAAVTCRALERTDRGGRQRAVSRCEAERVIVDFDPVDALAPGPQASFAGLVDQGVADLARLLEIPTPRAPRGAERIRVVVSERVGMSRTYGRTMLLPLRRVRDGRAPYLHEIVHALLPTPNRSTWLSEGLACYLESWTAENVGGYDAHVFTCASDRTIHEAAARHLETAGGRAVLSWVGVPGSPPGLFEERDAVARPFYVLSHSFTKYLVERLGLRKMTQVAASVDPEGELDRSSGRPASRWRADWLGERRLARAP